MGSGQKARVMSSLEGQIAELTIITDDDELAERFVAELEEHGTENPVTRHEDFQAAFDNLDSLTGGAPGQPSQIIILDLRNAEREGTRFLNQLHSRQPFKEPIILRIMSRKH